MIIIGIDPGKYGAVSILKNRRVIHVEDSPLMDCLINGKQKQILDEEKMNDFLLRFSMHTEPIHAFIEKQQILPQQGAVSGFSIGEGYGLWRGLLRGNGIPYSPLFSRTWRASVFTAEEIIMCNPPKKKGVKRTAKQKAEIQKMRKTMSIGKALRLFPSCRKFIEDPKANKAQDGRAEAVLIGYAGAQMNFESWR